MIELKKFLSSFFETALIEEISQYAELRSIAAGTVLIEPGELVSCVPIVVKGIIKITKQDDHSDQEVLLYYLREGDSCVVAFKNQLDTAYSSIRATVDENATVLMIKKEVASDWYVRYSSWREFVFRTYQKRFDSLLTTFTSTAFKSLDERIWEYILKKITQTNGRCLYVRHIDIAYDLNVSRETVSRLLKRLKEKGLLLLARNKICLALTV